MLRGFAIKRGRQYQLDRIEAGTMTVELLDVGGNFWPDNAGGGYYPNIIPGKRINLRATYGGTDYDLFTGFIESYQPRLFSTGTTTQTVVTITAVDLFGHLALAKLNDKSAQFTAANSESLYCLDNTRLSFGDEALTIAGWFMLDSKTDSRQLVSKGNDSAGSREYHLQYAVASDRFVFKVSNDGTATTTATANTLGSPSTGQWYFIVAYHNPTTNLIGISVNNGAFDTAAHTTGIIDGAASFNLGVGYSGSTYHDGRMGSVGIWREVKSAADITTLYNGGRRLLYNDLSNQIRLNMMAWWNLDEASGTRYDSHLDSDLTDGNTVTQANGYPSERSDVRIGRVLDAIGWPTASRDLDTGQVTVQATTLDDTNALEHLLAVADTEAGLVFIRGDGNVVFQCRHARFDDFSTPAATFGDDAGEMKYIGLGTEYGSSRIYNDIALTRTGGTEQRAGDPDSQATYGGIRTLSKSGLLHTDDTQVLELAQALRAAYRQPMLRVTNIEINPEIDPANLWPKVLDYDISKRITLRLNNASLDHEFHVEGIEYRATSSPRRWRIIWQLSKEAIMVWTDWTPTVTQSGAVTVTVTQAKYTKIGTLVVLDVSLAVTGSGTIANDIVIGGLPAACAPATTSNQKTVGSGLITDTGTAFYPASVVAVSSSTFKLVADSQNGYVGSNPSFALANGDFISFVATYAAA